MWPDWFIRSYLETCKRACGLRLTRVLMSRHDDRTEKAAQREATNKTLSLTQPFALDRVSAERCVCVCERSRQHIGLDMFSPTRRPKRINQMSRGVLNLPRNLLLDWTFGHSLINCHVEHHLFPQLSDHMCLKVHLLERDPLTPAWFYLLSLSRPPQVKPIVSRFLREKQLPYLEDSYLSRLQTFFHRYQELMVLAPPITELVGVQ